jgi:hypothetical protein
LFPLCAPDGIVRFNWYNPGLINVTIALAGSPPTWHDGADGSDPD